MFSKRLTIADKRDDFDSLINIKFPETDSRVDGVVIHHSRTVDRYGKVYGNGIQIMEWQLFSNENKPGGYHYLIHQNGQVEYVVSDEKPIAPVSFTQESSDNTKTKMENSHKIHICLLGWFEKDRIFLNEIGEPEIIPNASITPTIKQKNALIFLVDYLRRTHGFSDAGIVVFSGIDPEVFNFLFDDLPQKKSETVLPGAELNLEYTVKWRAGNLRKQGAFLQSLENLPLDTRKKIKRIIYPIIHLMINAVLALSFIFYLFGIQTDSPFALIYFIIYSSLLVLVGHIISLRWINPKSTSLIRLNQWKIRRMGDDPAVQMRWVPFEKVSRELVSAIYIAEDSNFAFHRGLQFGSILKALYENWKGYGVKGASSISQQLAKNLYLWPRRSLLRKSLDALIAILLELFLSKKRIFEIYINVIQFGKSVYGVEEACKILLKKSASDMQLEESALLAVSISNPFMFSVERPTEELYLKQAALLKKFPEFQETIENLFYS